MGALSMGTNWNDSLDHVITAILALVLVAGMFVLQLNQNGVPDWAIGSLGVVLGFYFRGRVNGQYNKSQMSRLEERERRQDAREIVQDARDEYR